MPLDPRDYVEVTIVAIVVVLMMVVVASLSLGGSGSITPQTDTNVTVESRVDVPSGVDVSATRENALAFGGHGYVDAPALSSGSVTVCASGQLADGANADATYTLYAARNGSFLLEYDAGNWMAYIENETSGDDAKATLPAPSPGSWRQVCGRYNASDGTVAVSRDGTVSAPVALSSATTSRNVSLNWVGRIDEVRTFGSAEANATLVAYGGDPIQPLPTATRTGRMMLDEGSGTSTKVYWAGTSATIINATWADGLDDVSLSEGSDYELYGNPFSILVPTGSYLVGAPVVFLTWSVLPLGSTLVQGTGAVMGLVVLVWILGKTDML